MKNKKSILAAVIFIAFILMIGGYIDKNNKILLSGEAYGQSEEYEEEGKDLDISVEKIKKAWCQEHNKKTIDCALFISQLRLFIHFKPECSPECRV